MKYNVTTEYNQGERYDDHNAYIVSWMPNASANGKVLQMLFEHYGEEEIKSSKLKRSYVMEKKVKFGIISDTHPDIVPGGVEKMEKFLAACRKENVDFIIELGDFSCKPSKEGERKIYYDKDKILSLFKNFEKPSYHAIGNHDCDDGMTKAELLAHYGVPNKSYYSFDMGGFHFVVLDTNYFLLNGKEYSYGEYSYGQSKDAWKTLDHVPEEEMDWLEEDLANAKYPTITFSHAALFPYSTLGSNEPLSPAKQRLVDILSNAPKGVYMCINGHYHFDRIFRTNHIWQYTINSMTNCWVGSGLRDEDNYTPELHEQYPLLKFVVPYEDAVFAIIEMDEKGATVKGVQSRVVGKTPEERGVYASNWMYAQMPMQVTAGITSRWIPFIKPNN